MRLLRRTGFAATLVTGLLLTGSAVHGLSDMDTTLELAATTPDRPVLVSHRAADECDRWRSAAREHDLDGQPALAPRT
jgi:hypothetical protein